MVLSDAGIVGAGTAVIPVTPCAILNTFAGSLALLSDQPWKMYPGLLGIPRPLIGMLNVLRLVPYAMSSIERTFPKEPPLASKRKV